MTPWKFSRHRFPPSPRKKRPPGSNVGNAPRKRCPRPCVFPGLCRHQTPGLGDLSWPPTQAGASTSARKSRESRPVATRVAITPPTTVTFTTQPAGADVWLDQTLKGKTPLTMAVDPGPHDLAIIRAGYDHVVETFDPSRINTGSVRTLQPLWQKRLAPAQRPAAGVAMVSMTCRTKGKLPVLVDGQNTGFLCPVKDLPLKPGVHRIGVFVPSKGRAFSFSTRLAPGPRTLRVKH